MSHFIMYEGLAPKLFCELCLVERRYRERNIGLGSSKECTRLHLQYRYLSKDLYQVLFCVNTSANVSKKNLKEALHEG